MLDLDAKDIAERVVIDGLISSGTCFVLSRGDIEDDYPSDILAKIIGVLSGKLPCENDLQGRRVRAIYHFLKKNKYLNDWKLPLGLKVYIQ